MRHGWCRVQWLRCGYRVRIGTGPADQLVMVRWMLGLVEVLLRDVVVRMMVVMVVEVVKEIWMSQVVLEVVVHRGRSHWGEMLVVVMVRGHVGQNKHRWGREAHGWGRWDHVHMCICTLGACPIHPAAGPAACGPQCGSSKDP